MTLVINFSGGKDSQAMLAYLCEKYPNIKKHVVFADTGWEHPGTEEWCRNQAARFGLTLNVVRNPNKDFFSMVLNRKKFPGMQQRQCTSDLKRGPVQTWIRRNVTDSIVINCMGLRSEESPARAKKRKLTRDISMTNGKRTVWNWLPIHDWKETKVRSFLAERFISLHPVYSYLKRFSCRVCIYMSKKDLQAVRMNDPQAIELIARVEETIGFTMMPGGSIKELTA